MENIFKITGSLNFTGYNFKILKIKIYKETKKSFICEGKRVDKSKLMKIDTILNENHKTLTYFTYCKEEDKENAINIIKEHIKNKVSKYKSEIDLLYSKLNNKTCDCGSGETNFHHEIGCKECC